MNKDQIGMSKLLRIGLSCWVMGLAASGLAGAAGSASAAVVVHVSMDEALPGGISTLRMRVDSQPGDPAIAGLQADLVLSTDQFELIGACSSDQSACENGASCPAQGRCIPTCLQDPRLTEHSLSAAYPDFQNVPIGRRRLRLPINPNSFPPSTFGSGDVLSCALRVRADAALGAIQLTSDASRFLVNDATSDPINATLVLAPGSIVSMLSTVTPTPTATSVPPTATATVATPTEVPPSVTPTPEGPTVTPTVEATHTAVVLDTATPSLTATTAVVETATATPRPSSTATSTAPVLTATPTNVPPTHTPSLPPATRTFTPSPVAPTATIPSATPTSGGSGSGSRSDGDGCAMAPRGNDLGNLGYLWLPVVMLLWRRRRIGA